MGSAVASVFVSRRLGEGTAFRSGRLRLQKHLVSMCNVRPCRFGKNGDMRKTIFPQQAPSIPRKGYVCFPSLNRMGSVFLLDTDLAGLIERIIA
jgi:hypothetical protein